MDYIHTHVVHTQEHTHTHTYAHIRAHTCTHAHIRTYTYTYAHTPTHTHTAQTHTTAAYKWHSMPLVHVHNHMHTYFTQMQVTSLVNGEVGGGLASLLGCLHPCDVAVKAAVASGNTTTKYTFYTNNDHK